MRNEDWPTKQDLKLLNSWARDFLRGKATKEEFYREISYLGFSRLDGDDACNDEYEKVEAYFRRP